MGNNPAALTAFQKTVALEPKNAEALNDCGACYINMHQIDKAFDALNHTIKVDPNYQKAYINFAAGYCEQHNYPMALTVLQRVVAINAKNDEARSAYASMIQLYNALRQPEQANAVKQKLAELQR